MFLNHPVIKYSGRFLLYLWRNFVDNKSTQSAAVLSYTTLLSIVPLLAVGFSLITAFPVFQNVQKDIQDFVFNNFVPTSGEVLQQYIVEFTGKASKLTAFGIAGLVLSSLLMMSAIDRAMNRIWRVNATRSRIYEFIIYWALLTLGPLLIGLSFAVTSYLFSLPLLSQEVDMPQIKQNLLRLLPYFAETLAFAFIYIVLPNRRVRFRHAFVGAAIAAVLFELAKKLFALFVSNFTSYEAIYGALATIPIFLMWVYLSWSIVLIGGEFTYALGTFREGWFKIRKENVFALVTALRVMGRLYEVQQKGKVCSKSDLLTAEPGLDEASLLQALDALIESGVVHKVSARSYALTRDIHTFTVLDLYRAKAWPLPMLSNDWAQQDEWNQRIYQMISEIDTGLEQAFNRPVGTIFTQSTESSG